jgi:hypothetical protein
MSYILTNLSNLFKPQNMSITLKNLSKTILPTAKPKPIGRWKIEYCDIKVNRKIDLSNQDNSNHILQSHHSR